MPDLPKIREPVRVFYGSGFYRTGRVRQVDEQALEVLVKFDCAIPDEWVGEDQLC